MPSRIKLIPPRGFKLFIDFSEWRAGLPELGFGPFSSNERPTAILSDVVRGATRALAIPPLEVGKFEAFVMGQVARLLIGGPF